MKRTALGFAATLFAAVSFAAALATSAAQAGSLIGAFAPNGGILTQRLVTGFENATDPGSAVVTDKFFFLSGIEPFNPGAPVFVLSNGQTTTPVGESAVPTKPNEATLDATSTYSLGIGAAQDRLTLDSAGTLSALTALTRPAGDPATLPADAFVSYTATFQFFIDDNTTNPAAPALDSAVGILRLPDLRALDPGFETLLALGVFVDGLTTPAALLTATTGGITAGADFTVLAGHSYSIQLDYRARVLAGTDPPFTLGIGVDLIVPDQTVPAPGTLATFGLGLAGLGIMRRRRRG